MTPREKAEKAKQHLDDELAKAVHAELREMLVTELEREPDIDRQVEIVKRLQLHRQTKQMYERYAAQLLVDAHKAHEQTLMDQLRERLHPWSGA
jgi:hypothetical protein